MLISNSYQKTTSVYLIQQEMTQEIIKYSIGLVNGKD